MFPLLEYQIEDGYLRAAQLLILRISAILHICRVITFCSVHNCALNINYFNTNFTNLEHDLNAAPFMPIN